MPHDPSAPGPRDPETGERASTILETDEDIRRALLANARAQPPGHGVSSRTVAEGPAMTGGGSPASLYRPTARPPIAMLTIYDDGKIDGEVIRIRDHRFVIGRTEGDLCIPLDGRMSARHAEITYQMVGGLHRWVVTDLQSTHGMFVRVSRTVLADKAELLVGNGRYRFDAPLGDPGATADFGLDASPRGQTQGWDDGPSPFRPPALTELIGKEIGNRTLLVKPEYWIGTDPSCAIGRPDDPFCEPRHARIYRGSKGGWHAEHNKTQNGLWLRMSQINVDAMVQFQVGEQRFRLKVS